MIRDFGKSCPDRVSKTRRRRHFAPFQPEREHWNILASLVVIQKGKLNGLRALFLGQQNALGIPQGRLTIGQYRKFMVTDGKIVRRASVLAYRLDGHVGISQGVNDTGSPKQIATCLQGAFRGMTGQTNYVNMITLVQIMILKEILIDGNGTKVGSVCGHFGRK